MEPQDPGQPEPLPWPEPTAKQLEEARLSVPRIAGHLGQAELAQVLAVLDGVRRGTRSPHLDGPAAADARNRSETLLRTPIRARNGGWALDAAKLARTVLGRLTEAEVRDDAEHAERLARTERLLAEVRRIGEEYPAEARNVESVLQSVGHAPGWEERARAFVRRVRGTIIDPSALAVGA